MGINHILQLQLDTDLTRYWTPEGIFRLNMCSINFPHDLPEQSQTFGANVDMPDFVIFQFVVDFIKG